MENNVFGLATDSDTHIMKNTEWGAVAYLSNSKYGKNSEVYINNNSNHITGCGGDSSSEVENTTCTNSYSTKTDNIYNQSTTGNISGIFDMSGGAYEYVMAYTTGANTEYGSSGFTVETFPLDKYIDTYISTADTQYSNRILGDATGEMGPFNSYNSSWYEDYARFAYSDAPWFARGGDYTSSSTGLFYFNGVLGEANGYYTFRIVLT